MSASTEMSGPGTHMACSFLSDRGEWGLQFRANMTRFLEASFFHEGVGNKVVSMHGWDIHICLDPSLEDASFKAPLISHLESRELVL